MELNISTGVKEYRLNGAVTVHFNPTDAAFAEKIVSAFTDLEKNQSTYKQDIEKAQSAEDVFDLARKWDTQMREKLDSAFDVPVCQALFGDINVYAVANGLPLWMNLLLAIMDEISTGFAGIGKDIPKKIQAYTDKYKNK